MIRCFTGLPGAGKSNALVNIAYKALRDGRPVYSNIAIKGCYKFEFTDLLEYRFPRGAVILLDEGGRNFNSKNFKSLPDEVFDLFTLHRHLDLDMYIAVQDFGMIDISIRRVVELTWWIKNYWFLPFYVCEGYYSLEKLGQMKYPDTRMFFMKSRKIRSMYDTRSMKKVFKSKEEIPIREWFPFDWKYKNLMQVCFQIIRIKVKKWYLKNKYQKKLLKQINAEFEKHHDE